MGLITLSSPVKENLKKFLATHKRADLITTYLHFVEQAHEIHPVIFLPERTVFPNRQLAISVLEPAQKLWRATEIKIVFDRGSVNEETSKIYICPFSGKVFGNNTHPNPQDAIYDWVASCPENTEWVGGLKSKRFHVSEDPEVIRSYMKPNAKEVVKSVFASPINGKLFHTREAALNDATQHYFKAIALEEVQNQNRYQMHDLLLSVLQTHLDDDRVTSFVEALAQDPFFTPYIEHWINEAEAE